MSAVPMSTVSRSRCSAPPPALPKRPAAKHIRSASSAAASSKRPSSLPSLPSHKAAQCSGHTWQCTCCRPRRLAVCRAQTTTTTTTTTTSAAAATAPAAPKILELAVPIRDVERTVQLAIVPEGKGQAIEVVGVAPGSAAEQAGVRVGQKIRSIMDPVRSDQMYPLQDRPSLRFVTHTIAMTRRPNLYITVEQPDTLELPAAAQPDAATPQQQGAAGAERNAVLTSIDDLLGESSEGATIAQQLATWYSELVGAGTIPAQQYSSVPLSTRVGATQPSSVPEPSAPGSDGEPWTDVQKRVQRRKDYLQEVSQRNDAPFFAGVAAAILLPAAIILGVAYFSGYLDNLYMNTLTRLT